MVSAAMSYLWVGLSIWSEARTGLLTALSVIAAATLVRLARGLPFTNPDHFDPDEVEDVVRAVKKLARALRALLGVTLVVMVLLVAVQPAASASVGAHFAGQVADVAFRLLSSAIGGGLAFALARMWQVVGSDLGLLDRQGLFIIRAVRRKQRKSDEEREAQGDVAPFKAPSNYGDRIH